MAVSWYLTHPQVAIDANVPVPEWSLSEKGRDRIVAARNNTWLTQVKRIVSSEERKAIETAELIGEVLGLQVEVRPDMGENDRSATGFITPDKFEAAADAFFATPTESWNGWEKAADAQSRIVAAVAKALSEPGAESPVLFVGHGAVGTLLKCHIAGRPISRREDQPGGGGNLYAFDFSAPKLLGEWTPIESFSGGQSNG